MSRQSAPREPLPLKQAVTRQVQSQSLTSDQLEKLLSMQQAVLEPAEQSPQRKPRRLAIAAIFTLCVLGSLLSWQQWNSQPDLSQAIASEVVKNHLKQNPLDIRTDNMLGIREYFTKLDFAPQRSSLLASISPDSSMLGGRYCSIQGVTAAQLRYQRQDGVSTLYEVGYDPEQFGKIPSIDRGEKPLSLMLKGLSVSLWVEKDLLMVSVSEP